MKMLLKKALSHYDTCRFLRWAPRTMGSSVVAVAGAVENPHDSPFVRRIFIASCKPFEAAVQHLWIRKTPSSAADMDHCIALLKLIVLRRKYHTSTINFAVWWNPCCCRHYLPFQKVNSVNESCFKSSPTMQSLFGGGVGKDIKHGSKVPVKQVS